MPNPLQSIIDLEQSYLAAAQEIKLRNQARASRARLRRMGVFFADRPVENPFQLLQPFEEDFSVPPRSTREIGAARRAAASLPVRPPDVQQTGGFGFRSSLAESSAILNPLRQPPRLIQIKIPARFAAELQWRQAFQADLIAGASDEAIADLRRINASAEARMLLSEADAQALRVAERTAVNELRSAQGLPPLPEKVTRVEIPRATIMPGAESRTRLPRRAIPLPASARTATGRFPLMALAPPFVDPLPPFRLSIAELQALANQSVAPRTITQIAARRVTQVVPQLLTAEELAGLAQAPGVNMIGVRQGGQLFANTTQPRPGAFGSHRALLEGTGGNPLLPHDRLVFGSGRLVDVPVVPPQAAPLARLVAPRINPAPPLPPYVPTTLERIGGAVARDLLQTGLERVARFPGPFQRGWMRDIIENVGGRRGQRVIREVIAASLEAGTRRAAQGLRLVGLSAGRGALTALAVAGPALDLLAQYEVYRAGVEASIAYGLWQSPDFGSPVATAMRAEAARRRNPGYVDSRIAAEAAYALGRPIEAGEILTSESDIRILQSVIANFNARLQRENAEEAQRDVFRQTIARMRAEEQATEQGLRDAAINQLIGSALEVVDQASLGVQVGTQIVQSLTPTVRPSVFARVSQAAQRDIAARNLVDTANVALGFLGADPLDVPSPGPSLSERIIASSGPDTLIAQPENPITPTVVPTAVRRQRRIGSVGTSAEFSTRRPAPVRPSGNNPLAMAFGPSVVPLRSAVPLVRPCGCQ